MQNEHIDLTLINASNVDRLFYTKKDLAIFLATVHLHTGNLQNIYSINKTEEKEADVVKAEGEAEVKVKKSNKKSEVKTKTLNIFTKKLFEGKFLEYLKNKHVDTTKLLDNNNELEYTYLLLVLGHLWNFHLLNRFQGQIKFICEVLEIEQIDEIIFDKMFIMYRNQIVNQLPRLK